LYKYLLSDEFLHVLGTSTPVFVRLQRLQKVLEHQKIPVLLVYSLVQSVVRQPHVELVSDRTIRR